MKKSGSIIFRIIWVIILASSCTKEIHIPIPPIESKPVINCFFTPDSIFTLYVGKPVPIYDDEPRVLDHANVYLFEEQKCVDTLRYSEGLYFSSYVAKAEKSYDVKVQCPGFDTVFAQDMTPSPPEKLTGFFRDDVFRNEDGDPVSQVNLNIQDDPNENNFYELLLKITYRDPFDSAWHRNVEVGYAENNPDPVLENEGLIPYDPSTILFSDELFNGTRYTLTINYHGPYYVNNGETVNYSYFLVVFFRAVSKEYYLYKKQLIKHLYNQDSDIFDGMGNPVQMYSNVQGGYGIFAGYVERRDTIPRKNN